MAKRISKSKEDVEKDKKSGNICKYPTINAPDGGWGWVVVVSALLCNVIVDGVGQTFGVLLPKFKEHFHQPSSKVSLVGSVLYGTYSLLGPVSSGFVKLYGCRKVIIAGSLIACLGFLTAAASPNIEMLILTYGVIGGIGFGMVYLAANVMVGLYFEKRRPFANGIAVCGSGIGTVAFSPLLEYLSDKYDLKNVLILTGGIVLNGVICGMLMRPLIPKRQIGHPTKPTGNQTNGNEMICKDADISDTLKDQTPRYRLFVLVLKCQQFLDISLLKNVPFIVMCIGNIFAVNGCLIPFYYIVESALTLDIPKTDAAFLISVIGITNIVGRVLAGLVANTRIASPLLVNNVSMLLATTSLFLQPFCTTYPHLVVFCVCFGLGFSGFISMTSIILCDFLGLQRLSAALGLLILARGIAAVGAPPLEGFIYEVTGTFDATFYFGGGMFLIGTILHAVLHLPCLKLHMLNREQVDKI